MCCKLTTCCLRNEKISDEDYNEYLSANSILAEVIGPTASFQHYANFYLALDVIILGLVLKNFFGICHAINGISPQHFVSISSYSFQALLHNNKYKPEIPKILIPKVEVQKYLQASIRGGYSQIFNKKMVDFDPKMDYAGYIDMNSLYPSVMGTKKLPYEFIRWVPEEDLTIDYLKSRDDSLYHFVECDIAPLAERFQEKVSKLPLFPENCEVKPEWLSEDQKYRWGLSRKGKEFQGDTINCVTFFEKKNCICSWSYLREAIAVGYEVTKIHKISEFKADFVMADYVNRMYKLKQEASIEKGNLERLLKTVEDPTEKAKIKSYRDWETDRKSTRLNSSHSAKSRMPSSA